MLKTIGVLCKNCTYLVYKDKDYCNCKNIFLYKNSNKYLLVIEDFNNVEFLDLFISDSGQVVKTINTLYRELGYNIKLPIDFLRRSNELES